VRRKRQAFAADAVSLWRLNQSLPVINELARSNTIRYSELSRPIQLQYGTIQRPRRLRLRSDRLTGSLEFSGSEDTTLNTSGIADQPSGAVTMPTTTPGPATPATTSPTRRPRRSLHHARRGGSKTPRLSIRRDRDLEKSLFPQILKNDFSPMFAKTVPYFQWVKAARFIQKHPIPPASPAGYIPLNSSLKVRVRAAARA
jgi:hypothetical protein